MILGTISAYSSGSGIALTIDGESTPTTKKYLFLESYWPVVGDRVLVEEIADTYVILGKVTDTRNNSRVMYSKRIDMYSDSGYVEFTIFNGELWVKNNGGSQWKLARG